MIQIIVIFQSYNFIGIAKYGFVLMIDGYNN